jgi:hypothetical protein
MKTRKLLYWFAAIVLLGLIEYATATTNISSPDSFQYPILVRLAELRVTATQESQIRAILQEAQPGFEPLVKQYITKRRSLRATIHTAPVNETAIRTQANRVAQLEADLAVKRARIADRIRTVLTPDQITKLKALAGEFDSRVDSALLKRYLYYL